MKKNTESLENGSELVEVKPLDIDFIFSEAGRVLRVAEDGIIKEMLKKSDVYDDIGRDTFEQIARDEELDQLQIKLGKMMLEIIRKNYGKEMPIKITDQELECKNAKCRCKVRLKENEGFKR